MSYKKWVLSASVACAAVVPLALAAASYSTDPQRSHKGTEDKPESGARGESLDGSEIQNLRRRIRQLERSSSLTSEHLEQLGRGTGQDGAVGSGVVGEAPDPSGPSVSHKSIDERRVEAFQRSERQAVMLETFMTQRKPDDWARTAESQILGTRMPSGHSIADARCVADICRVKVKAPDSESMPKVMSALIEEKNQAFARQLEAGEDGLTYEVYVSPEAVEWPSEFYASDT